MFAYSSFADVFSPAYFWCWNARLDEAALCAQLEDMPFDSKDPTFPFGHGLSY